MKIDKALLPLLLAAALFLSACGTSGVLQSASANSQTSQATDEAAQTASQASAAEMFTDRDLEIGYDEETSAYIALTGEGAACDSDAVRISGSTVTITEEGSYVLSGTLSDGSIVVQAEEQTEMFAEAAYWAKKWVDDGVYPRDIKTNTAAHSSLGDDHNYSGFGMFEYIATDENMNDPDYHYSLMYPDGYFVNKSPTNNLMAINKNAANPERILMFYDLLYSDSDVYDAVLYGIEGDTYMIDDTGAYVWAEEGMDQTNTSWMEYTGQWGFWRLEQMKPTGQRSQNCWDLNAEFMENPGNVTSPLAAFVPDPEPIKNELAARDALYSEFGVLIEYGLVDDVDAAIAEYIQMQKDAGLDKIIQEVQAQVDAYMASRQ